MDRNPIMCCPHMRHAVSLSARRAWIEISLIFNFGRLHYVALRKESVDRNMTWGAKKYATTYVALRKESVDRNPTVQHAHGVVPGSLSARRAWIEMRVVCSAVIAFSRRSPQGERG